jgi:hypothetical protein
MELWRQTLESKGFRLSTTKTEYMRCGFRGAGCEEANISLDGQIVPMRDSFQYVGSMLQSNGHIDDDVYHWIKTWWIKWRQTSEIICDKKVSQKLKGKFCRMEIRPVIYGADCWPTKIQYIQHMRVAEMRVLWWMCGHTRKDRIRKEVIHDRVGWHRWKRS